MEQTQIAQTGSGQAHRPWRRHAAPTTRSEAVQAALRDVLAPLGGMAAFVKPGERIALKPNLLMPTAPEKAVVTHPAVVAAVAVAVKEAGGTTRWWWRARARGVVHAKPVIERAFRKVGYRRWPSATASSSDLDTAWETVLYPEAVLAKRYEVMSPILRADGVINLPKFKTHMFMTFSGAAKNLFGVIPGLNKAAYHARLDDPMRFADMLLDVADFVAPSPQHSGRDTGHGGRRTGDRGHAAPVGSAGGRRRHRHGGRGLLPDRRDRPGEGAGAGGRRASGACGAGGRTTLTRWVAPVAELQVEDFAHARRPRAASVSAWADSSTGRCGRFLRRFDRLPRPKAGRCTLCAACERACPGKAITMDERSKVAKVDDSLCIRCYCCHEVCPSAAIDLEFKGVGRLMKRLGMMKWQRARIARKVGGHMATGCSDCWRCGEQSRSECCAANAARAWRRSLP